MAYRCILLYIILYIIVYNICLFIIRNTKDNLHFQNRELFRFQIFFSWSKEKRIIIFFT